MLETRTLRTRTQRELHRREVEISPTLALERLQVFKAAFLADPRPGFIFEHGRLLFANEAAKRLVGSSPSTGPFLEALKAGLAGGFPDPKLCLRLGTRRFLMELHPARARTAYSTRICFLVRRAAVLPAIKELTDRELGVLTWLMKGFTNGEIACRLGISIETVRKHVANARKKTGTKTRAGLVGCARRR